MKVFFQFEYSSSRYVFPLSTKQKKKKTYLNVAMFKQASIGDFLVKVLLLLINDICLMLAEICKSIGSHLKKIW